MRVHFGTITKETEKVGLTYFLNAVKLRKINKNDMVNHKNILLIILYKKYDWRFFMDYEIMMNGNVKLGQQAPEFEAQTTMGQIRLSDYRGKWVVLFSHPGDFTPVCTTEIIAFSKANTYFEKMNTCLLRLKCRLKSFTFSLDL